MTMNTPDNNPTKLAPNKTSTLLYIVLLLIPLLINLALHPVWLAANTGTMILTIATLSEMLLNCFVSPIYLALITGYYAIKKHKSFSFGIIFSIPVVYGSIYEHYWNWGSVTGMTNNPDWGTGMIMLVCALVSSIVLAVGMIIVGIKWSRS